MECVRVAIAGSRAFISASDFDPWMYICGVEQSAFMERSVQLFVAHLARNKESGHQLLRSANKLVISHVPQAIQSRQQLVVREVLLEMFWVFRQAVLIVHAKERWLPACLHGWFRKKGETDVESQSVGNKRKPTVKKNSSQSKNC